MLLFGRLLQGTGISAPRAVTLALVRDRYKGRAMAQVMSFAITVFVLVPMIAPTFGQALLLLSGWRSIFGGFALIAMITVLWFSLRMPETLAPKDRAPFSLRRIIMAIREIVSIRLAIGYTVASGLVSGAFLGYLNSAQQIFQERYALLGIALLAAGQPPLWFLMAYLMTAFLCIGILFGNMNALAMKPLGHVAGIGAAG